MTTMYASEAEDVEGTSEKTMATENQVEGLLSCAAIHMSNLSAPGGIYTIYPGGRTPGVSVWCDMSTDEGGWTVIQWRREGSLQFNQTWDIYRDGFGQPQGEIWLGNDNIHRITSTQPSELRVDIWDFQGDHRYAKYSSFSVDDESSNYTMNVTGYSGDAGDALDYHNYEPFSTIDRDNDEDSRNCATSNGGGGWWYYDCDTANLNGRYFLGGVIDEQGLEWNDWPGHHWDYSFMATSMMVRPRT